MDVFENSTTAHVLFKSPKLKDIHQKLVNTPHNYEMLMFCSEDGRNIFRTTQNSCSLWKNLCYRSKSLSLRKRYSKVYKMLSNNFKNHKEIELNWYCELKIEHVGNDTHSLLSVQKKIIFPLLPLQLSQLLAFIELNVLISSNVFLCLNENVLYVVPALR